MRPGVQASPTECTNVTLIGKYLDLDNSIGRQASAGWEANLIGTYHYSQDLAFTAGYSHFFGADWAKRDRDDSYKPSYDCFFAQTTISF